MIDAVSGASGRRPQINFRIDAKLHKELQQLVDYIQDGGYMEGPVHHLDTHNGQSITTLAKAMVTQAVEHALPIVRMQYNLHKLYEFALEQRLSGSEGKPALIDYATKTLGLERQSYIESMLRRVEVWIQNSPEITHPGHEQRHLEEIEEIRFRECYPEI